MKPFPIQVVGLGPGSQPEEEALDLLGLPREVERFCMPSLPTADQVAHLAAGQAVVAELIACLKDYQGDAQQYPVLDLDRLDQDNRQLINQLLGEGEVSARVMWPDGCLLDIQESVFAGVWRVLETDSGGHVRHDRIEVCPIPAAVWLSALQSGAAQLSVPDLSRMELMNAPALISEIAAQIQLPQPFGQAAHVINFSLLPMSPADLDCITAILGEGPSGVFSRGYGKCRILATGLKNVWRVQYFNGMNAILMDTIEITCVPEVALASADDLADSLERLEEALQWLQED